MYNRLVHYTVPLIVLFLFFSLSSRVNAQVVINEFSPSSDPEWVELYNTSSTNTVTLEGWRIVDANLLTTDDIDLSGCISPQGFRLFSRAAGWLNNTGGDTITLKDNNGNEVNSVIYGTGGVIGIPSSSKSASKTPDGGSTWVILDLPTPVDGTCQLSDTPTPIPTPTLSPTSAPTPTKTPIPTKIPTPTPISTPTPTKIITPTPSPTKSLMTTPKIEESPSAGATGLVLAENIASESPTPTPEVLTAGFAETNLAKILIILGGIFLTACGIVFAKWRKEISN